MAGLAGLARRARVKTKTMPLIGAGGGRIRLREVALSNLTFPFHRLPALTLY